MTDQLAELRADLLRQDNSPPSMVSASTPGVAREIMEVQAMVAMAKKFPRDITVAVAKIEKECTRMELAKGSHYSYPRGGKKVEGPSIRLAESIARNWGNLVAGTRQVEQFEDRTFALAYSWDLESNTRIQKEFWVPHERHTGKGVTKLTDPRDIYEAVANQGARRMRSCILASIPGDVVELASQTCKKTLEKGIQGANREDKIKEIIRSFDNIGVTVKMLENFLGHSMSGTDIHQMVELSSIYNSIKDGVAKKSQFFSEEPDGGKKVKEEGAKLDREVDDSRRQKLVGQVKELAVQLGKKNVSTESVFKTLGVSQWSDLDGWKLSKLEASFLKLKKFLGE